MDQNHDYDGTAVILCNSEREGSNSVLHQRTREINCLLHFKSSRLVSRMSVIIVDYQLMEECNGRPNVDKPSERYTLYHNK